MTDTLIDLGNGFWSIRGHYRIAGLIDIGTQAALVEIAPKRFIMLDSYLPSGRARGELLELVHGGALEALFNLHPFHTEHCSAAAHMFPGARHYGTARHKRVLPKLEWQSETTDEQAAWADYSDHIEIFVPAGVDFISQNEHVHFSSVLAFHRASGTIHVDDTFMVGLVPPPSSWLKGRGLRLHPTLSRALHKQPGAADDFRKWLTDLADAWSGARQVCAAHRGIVRLAPGEFRQQALAALKRAEGTLAKHASRYG